MYELFREVGRELFLAGNVTARHGNLSVRDGDRIYITRSGSMLSRLQPDDIISTRMEPSERDKGCSRELVVHRAVYHATDALAICHAHPPHTMFRSLIEDEIRPLDSEARFVIGESVPVLVPKVKIGSAEAAEMLAEALAASRSRCCAPTGRSRSARRCGTHGASSACSRSHATSLTCATASGCPCSEVARDRCLALSRAAHLLA